MDIQNPGEFAQYSRLSDSQRLTEAVDFADEWSDVADRMNRQYGGHGQTIDDFLDDALDRIKQDGLFDDADDIFLDACDVLSKFWRHKDHFNNWFSKKVIIVKPTR